MCGIAGYLVRERVEEGVLQNMVNCLYHRGPDTEGYFQSGAFRTGMRRLSINDLETGDQPLFNESKDVVLIYNGEIYNSPELRKRLEQKGFKFRTNSDGEVICHLYELYGEDLFEELDGMFAAALWIEKEKKLILARDIPGEKPLYYSQLSNNEIVFASELKSLVEYPGLDLKLNYQAIWDFPTYLWVPEPITIYENVFALLPGHLMVVTEEGMEVKAYKNKFNDQAIGEEEPLIIEETRRVIEYSIKSRLLSDVPLGSFLSGGLDSSIVVGIATKYLDNLSTFTIGFENLDDPYHGKADESGLAQEYAEYLGTNHHTIRVTGKDFSDSLMDFCKYGDQPFAVSSGLGILAIAKAARQAGLKVLLSGDGADECFGGYSWYFHYGNPLFENADYSENGSTISFQNFGLDLNTRLQALANMPPQKRAWAWHYYAAEEEKAQLFNRLPFEQTKSSHRYFTNYNPKPKWEAEDFIRQDRKFYFPFEMLRKVDRMTSAHSIEGRVPFAAPAVLNHAEKLRYKHMVKGQHLKWVLRAAFEDVLPKSIFNRPKHGFNVPVDHWLKSDWKELFEHSFSTEGMLYKKEIIHKDTIKIARQMRDDKERLNGHTLFCYMMLNMWLENFSKA